jgi:hypothetical protein
MRLGGLPVSLSNTQIAAKWCGNLLNCGSVWANGAKRATAAPGDECQRAEEKHEADRQELSNYRVGVIKLNTRRQALVEEFTVEWRVRFFAGGFKVLPGAGQVASAAVKFAERGVDQVIVP